MSKLIVALSRYGISVNYRCKSLYAKYKGRKCKDFGTAICMTCKLCQAEMPAADATRLLDSFGRRSEQ